MTFWSDRTTTAASKGLGGYDEHIARNEPILIPPPSNAEQSLSLLTLATATLESLPSLTDDEQTRLRQALIRMSNCERKFAKEK